MRRFRFARVVFSLLVMLCITKGTGAYAKEGKEFYFDGIDKFKVWKIKFTHELKSSNGEEYEAVLTDGTGRIQRLKLEKGENDGEYLIKPPKQGYIDSENKLVIPNTVKDRDGNKLDDSYIIRFNVYSGLKIRNVLQENYPFVKGDKMSIFVSSTEEEMVQYRVDIVDSNGNVLSQTEGYDNAVLGNSVQKFDLDDLTIGRYKLRVYVKYAGKDGEHIINGIRYDDLYETELDVQAIDSQSLVDIDLDFKGNYIHLKDGYLLSEESSLEDLRIEGVNNLQFEVYEINVEEGKPQERIASYGSDMSWNPTKGDSYLLKINIKSQNGKYIGSKVLSFKTGNVKISYIDYNMTLDEFARKEKYNEKNTIRTGNNYVSNATLDQIKYYLNPQNFMDEYGIYQFMVLNYVEGMTVEDMNEILKGKGILDGKGAAVLEGAKKYNINPAYLIAHIILETGHGRSKLANGVWVDGRKVYNMYGIQAVDSNPIGKGSRYAQKQGWFTPEMAIIEGAKWVGENYINSEEFQQNTLYEMKWNKDIMWHQYSTDVKWPYGQIKRIKQYLNGKSKLKMILEIPRFK